MRVTDRKKPVKTTYKMDDIPLEEVESYPYLGVEISKDLKWASHKNKISNKANKMLGLLRRNIFNCSAEGKVITYKALVRHRLEYSSAVWDHHYRTHINIVERIQRRALRFVSKDYSRETRATSLVHNLEWDTLEERRTKSNLQRGSWADTKQH